MKHLPSSPRFFLPVGNSTDVAWLRGPMGGRGLRAGQFIYLAVDMRQRRLIPAVPVVACRLVSASELTLQIRRANIFCSSRSDAMYLQRHHPAGPLKIAASAPWVSWHI